MECHSPDSKVMFKVFDASTRKRIRKKRERFEDTSLVTDDSTSGCNATVCRASSAKASLQNVPDSILESPVGPVKRDRDSSPSITRSHSHIDHSIRSSRRHHHRSKRDGVSLALKAGMVSTPRSGSPRHNDTLGESITRDQDSYIYAFVEEAIKKEKRKHRHYRRHEDRHASRDREPSPHKEHRHHHRRKRESSQTKQTTAQRETDATKSIDPNLVLETFAKLCSQLNNKSDDTVKNLPRTQSHKSLQCEVLSKRGFYDENQIPVKLRSNYNSQDNMATPKVRSQEHLSKSIHHNYTESKDHIYRKTDKYPSDYMHENNDGLRYISKHNIRTRNGNDSDGFKEYNTEVAPNRSRIFVTRDGEYYKDDKYYRNLKDEFSRDKENDVKRQYEQGHEFESSRDKYIDDNRDRRTYNRRSGRNEMYKVNDRKCEEIRDRGNYNIREGRDKFIDERDKYYDDKGRISSRSRNYDNLIHKEHVSRRNLDSRFDRNSVVSRDDDYKERDRYSERERDSGLSVADGDMSVISARSNYLRGVKQEIAEQREAMDKMMQLWKELMRCFKGMSQKDKDDKNMQETATTARNSAVEQLKLWRECMRRYETVARDVGDTDARLKEEINKQRSEMAEMATMWQECLQKYRDMSNDFNNLKQKLAIGETPSRIPASASLVCGESEGGPPLSPSYRIPASYMQTPSVPSQGNPPYANMGSPLRSRASVPPWWWYGQDQKPRVPSPRRRSSPESRGSRDRRNGRHKERDHRDDSRYKEKNTKSGVAARSEHRHKKR